MNYANDGSPIIHRAVTCLRKRPFHSEAEALDVLLHMRRSGRDCDRLQPYECAHCTEWHLGNRPPRMASILRALKTYLASTVKVVSLK